ncbi:MAG: hypothetical protein QM757_01575, partial [Paludibaculum sp.]
MPFAGTAMVVRPIWAPLASSTSTLTSAAAPVGLATPTAVANAVSSQMSVLLDSAVPVSGTTASWSARPSALPEDGIADHTGGQVDLHPSLCERSIVVASKIPVPLALRFSVFGGASGVGKLQRIPILADEVRCCCILCVSLLT